MNSGLWVYTTKCIVHAPYEYSDVCHTVQVAPGSKNYPRT